jgi:hypothetical protein
MAEMRELTSADRPKHCDIGRLRQLEAHLDTLLDASASRCGRLADRLALVEEHASEPLPEDWISATGAATLAQRLRAAG